MTSSTVVGLVAFTNDFNFDQKWKSRGFKSGEFAAWNMNFSKPPWLPEQSWNGLQMQPIQPWFEVDTLPFKDVKVQEWKYDGNKYDF